MICLSTTLGASPPRVSLQEDGSLVVSDTKDAVADFVKQGTPRQSIEVGGQTCNVSYGYNSAGKKTILFHRKQKLGVKIPYGPYLALAALLWLLGGKALFAKYLFNNSPVVGL